MSEVSGTGAHYDRAEWSMSPAIMTSPAPRPGSHLTKYRAD